MPTRAPDYEQAALGLILDRMEVEDVGGNPARLAAAIHRQLDDDGPVPVMAIARALDIHEIRQESLVGLEAALVTTAERGEGAIVVSQAASRQRQRFSIGHELGHFLNPRHHGAWDGAFRCDRTDMQGRSRSPGLRRPTAYEVQERQANEFAIELLAPRRRIKEFLDSDPTLAAALELAKGIDISREAAFRRYAELHDANIAIVFARHDRFTYAVRGRSFPKLTLQNGLPMPWLPQDASADLLTDIEETGSSDWIDTSAPGKMSAQTLYQDDQRSTTLLICHQDEDDENASVEDAASRFGRF